MPEADTFFLSLKGRGLRGKCVPASGKKDFETLFREAKCKYLSSLTSLLSPETLFIEVPLSFFLATAPTATEQRQSKDNSLYLC
ncbi:MAG: hypothetical protein IJW39_05050, partial [Opitutales bacterium]|nr:hypothetical protein [Opitutales bacterium]